MIVLHEEKYYTAEDICKYLPLTIEKVLEKIESGQLESCLIDGKIYVHEEDMLKVFKGKKK